MACGAKSAWSFSRRAFPVDSVIDARSGCGAVSWGINCQYPIGAPEELEDLVNDGWACWWSMLE